MKQTTRTLTIFPTHSWTISIIRCVLLSSIAVNGIVLKKVHDDKKHIAFITDSSGNILAIGTNSYALTSGIHAERDAIDRLKNLISRGKIKERSCRHLCIYVFAIGVDLKMSRPCTRCQNLLGMYRHWFSRIYFSTGDPDNILDEMFI